MSTDLFAAPVILKPALKAFERMLQWVDVKIDEQPSVVILLIALQR